MAVFVFFFQTIPVGVLDHIYRFKNPSGCRVLLLDSSAYGFQHCWNQEVLFVTIDWAFPNEPTCKFMVRARTPIF